MLDNDLISRAAARDVINTWGRLATEDVRMDLLHHDLNALPAVDAVPVVRCKDCRYYNTNYCGDGFGWCERNGIGHGTSDDWFCADGEK